MTPGYQLDGSEPETEKVDYRAKQDKACVLLCVCVSCFYIGGGVQPVCNVGLHGDPL